MGSPAQKIFEANSESLYDFVSKTGPLSIRNFRKRITETGAVPNDTEMGFGDSNRNR